jgi:putative glutamine amidotransferase
MQLLNVALGGTLVQHLPDTVGHADHRRSVGSFDDADHDVRLAPGSLAARAARSETTPVKSHHHQGIREVGSGLAVTGRAAEDGAVEAIEDPRCPFVLGVLWHPEEDEKSQLIKALVSEVS